MAVTTPASSAITTTPVGDSRRSEEEVVVPVVPDLLASVEWRTPRRAPPGSPRTPVSVNYDGRAGSREPERHAPALSPGRPRRWQAVRNRRRRTTCRRRAPASCGRRSRQRGSANARLPLARAERHQDSGLGRDEDGVAGDHRRCVALAADVMSSTSRPAARAARVQGFRPVLAALPRNIGIDGEVLR